MALENGFYGPFDEERQESRYPELYRTSFQVDRDRIIHSYAFRRLQGKTQVFRPGEYDFYRTRLTHTIEVSQIGRSICNLLRRKSECLNEKFYVDPDLVEAVCLAHDLGHPPFGHAGEHLLNELMDSFGGFEGNAQTLRLLTETIWHSTSPGERVGLNATRALLDGVLKYKRPRSEVESKNHFIYDNQMKHVKFVHGAIPDREILSTSVECQIMDWADDIAYSVGDVVDGVHARFITPDKLRNWRSEKRHEFVIEELLRMLSSESINRFAGRKIGEFIEACQLKMSHADPVLAEKSNRYRYVLKVRDDKRAEQECLKQVSIDLVFASPTVRQLEYKAQEMLRQLFEILKGAYVCEGSSKRRLLNEDIELMFHSAEGIPSRARVLCDHISGMSDDYAVRTFRRLVEPEFGSIVDLV